jgi:flagellar motility protein MotE (MotC chaperone)
MNTRDMGHGRWRRSPFAHVALFSHFSLVFILALGIAGLVPFQTSAEAQQRDLMTLPKVAPGSLPINGDYWALLIGVDDYQIAPKLETAVKDVTGLRDVLVTRYGFSLDKTIMLINSQATRTNIEHELYKLGQLAKTDDSVLIYYAGHGQYDEEGRLGWWVPVEGQPQNPGTFITNASIRDYIEGMKARHVYLVADSCFSGTLFGKARGMPPINDQFFARLYAKRSRWGLTSGGMEPVTDRGKGGHSLFAYHFISLLTENTEPYLIPSMIFDRIAPGIANNAEQTPRSEPLKGAGDEGGQFIFRLAVPLSAPASPSSPKSGPSAALLQAEQELKALEQQERVADDEEKLAILQQQIQEKKKRVEEKRKQVEGKRKQPDSAPSPMQEARARPGDGAKRLAGVMDAIRVEGSRRGVGVVITDLEPDSAAEAAGLQPGDVIQEVNRQVVKTVEEFQSLAAKAPRRGPVLLLIDHNGTFRFLALKGK